jgi:mannose-6-phosphate isomerase-like protein (cupin superfamily)
MNFTISIAEAAEQLSKEEAQRFTTVMRNGSMSVEYYKPVGKDLQKPHQQDELYIVASGIAVFLRNGEKINCKTGDVLFVPAAMDHRFESFNEEFATWVVFYGPSGGETPA